MYIYIYPQMKEAYLIATNILQKCLASLDSLAFFFYVFNFEILLK